MTNERLDDTPWLREMVDEDLLALFADDDEEIARAVRHFIALSREQDEVEMQLIDLVATSLEHLNDDSSASMWAIVILGEIGSVRSIPVLQNALLADEVLQDAARIALLRIGHPAVEAIMDAVDEEENPSLSRAAYPLLGMVGVLEDDLVNERVADFFQARLPVERRALREDRSLEELFQAIARIGDRRQLETMKQILREEYSSNNPALQDSIELLEENVAGVAIGSSTPPWEERYGWVLSF